MKLELLILTLTGALIYNTYYDGKLLKSLAIYKKYYKMVFIGFSAFCLYLMLKKNPMHLNDLLLHTKNGIRQFPIDKSAMDVMTPVFDLSSSNMGFMNQVNSFSPFPSSPSFSPSPSLSPSPSFERTTHKKRAVSETKKKYVASMQNWKCGQCKHQLTHTFEVDHRRRLDQGGTNDVSNLVALCRECHGQKTAFENM